MHVLGGVFEGNPMTAWGRGLCGGRDDMISKQLERKVPQLLFSMAISLTAETGALHFVSVIKHTADKEAGIPGLSATPNIDAQGVGREEVSMDRLQLCICYQY